MKAPDSPDWKAVTTHLVENHRKAEYGYVFPLQGWTQETVPDLNVGGHPASLVDVGSEDLVVGGREVTQKVLRRWLWDLRETRALSPHRLNRSVVWHLWDEENQESVFGIAAFTRYDAAERIERRRAQQEIVQHG
jgi:hypothetical protein